MKEKRDGTCITDDHRRVTDTNNYISSSMGWSRDGKKDRHLSDRIELSVRVCACVCCSTRRTTAPPVAPVIYCRSFARPWTTTNTPKKKEKEREGIGIEKIGWCSCWWKGNEYKGSKRTEDRAKGDKLTSSSTSCSEGCVAIGAGWACVGKESAPATPAAYRACGSPVPTAVRQGSSQQPDLRRACLPPAIMARPWRRRCACCNKHHSVIIADFPLVLQSSNSARP